MRTLPAIIKDIAGDDRSTDDLESQSLPLEHQQCLPFYSSVPLLRLKQSRFGSSLESFSGSGLAALRLYAFFSLTIHDLLMPFLRNRIAHQASTIIFLTACCSKHILTMKQKAPASAETPTKACNPTQPKPRRTRKPIIRFQAVELKRRFHNDLPFLPDRMPQIR